jgi:hypothetical protein
MAASDVLAQFMPNLQAAKGYLPDANMQAQLIQNITDAQQQRIKEMADLSAQSAGAPYAGLQQALSSAKEGYHLAEESKLNKAKLDQSQATTEGQNIQNKRSQMSLGAEEQYQNWLKQPVDANNPDGGSRADKLNQAGYDKDLLSVDAEKQRQGLQFQDEALKSKQILSEVASNGFNLQSAKRADEAQAFTQAAMKITANPNLTDQDKQTQLNKMIQDAQTQGGMDPRSVNALGAAAWGKYQEAIAAKNQAAISSELNATSLPAYGTMKDIAKEGVSGASAVKALQQQLQTMKAGSVGYIAGPQAEAATRGAIGTLRQLASQGDVEAGTVADQMESHNPIAGSNQSILQNFIGKLSSRVQEKFQTEQGLVTGKMQDRPEFKGAAQAVQSLGDASGQRPKNQANIFGAPGQTVTVDNRSFTNPQRPSGTALATPAGPPPSDSSLFNSIDPNAAARVQAAQKSAIQQNVNNYQQQVQQPGLAPPPTAPSFDPSLRQPLQGP